MEKQREEFQDLSSSLGNTTDPHNWFHSPKTGNPLSVSLMFLMVLFSSKRPIKAYRITRHISYIFQFHNLLTKMTAGHCNLIFTLREAIMPGTRADVTASLSGWVVIIFFCLLQCLVSGILCWWLWFLSAVITPSLNNYGSCKQR